MTQLNTVVVFILRVGQYLSILSPVLVSRRHTHTALCTSLANNQ